MSGSAEGGQHLYRGRVAWVDTDASGRIHFTAAFRWAEAAEHDLLRSLGHSFHGGFPRVDVQATYRAALRFDDAFELALGVVRVGRSSIAYAWTVHTGGRPAVEGRHSVVYVGDGERPLPLPEAFRGQLAGMLQAAPDGVPPS
ncbi:acyl-CoA thioesterase [Geodermatophilus sabuli]|uniref:Acyl-CoA thioesterase n=1 Tax=Geodermatophilus sabuli TaxID=1564158 RepID=A0A7K3VWG6_9ACTN|nr:thioesterase family protein [Geodermatophilus sabuli]NEK56710.1 acyl-CoA thioesterase [Geodermatophilus sabuli]